MPNDLHDVHLYRMSLPEHECPWGLKAIALLERRGIAYVDHRLSSQEDVNTFKQRHNVPTTPQIFSGDKRIGGYGDLAEWLGEDRRSDLVLLDIKGENYPTPNVASADTLAIGQWVASLGGPFGVQQSVSAGLVSNQARPYPSPVESKLVRFVQSDVVIHPGSSGGPLIDACGRIVAMNSAILGPGMSFSIRIDHALAISEKLLAEGEFERGYIGIAIDTYHTSEKAGQLRIKRVVENGPAAQAGLQPGDIITAIDKKTLISEFDIKWLVAITEPGESLSVSITRGDSKLVKSVEVDSSP